MSEDSKEEIPKAFDPEDTKNRLAAAAEDMHKISNHNKTGNHPEVNGV
jgi:hypothetical protein